MAGTLSSQPAIRSPSAQSVLDLTALADGYPSNEQTPNRRAQPDTRTGVIITREPVIARGAKHPQLRGTTPRGELRVFAVPETPSDWRSAENVRHDPRKILRSDAMLATPKPRSARVKQPSPIEVIERRLAEVERRLGIPNGW